jgi:hypothetical protein
MFFLIAPNDRGYGHLAVCESVPRLAQVCDLSQSYIVSLLARITNPRQRGNYKSAPAWVGLVFTKLLVHEN